MNPPEYDAPVRTETQRLADDIAHQASLIRRDWDHVLEATAPSRKPGTGGGKTAHITLNDEDPSTVDIDATTKLMHLRREAQDVLTSWSRLIMEERPVTNSKSLPLTTSVQSMCTFIERQSDWLSGTDHGPYALEELSEIRKAVHAYTDPYKREWHRLGQCPFIIDERFCGGTVRIKIESAADEAACDKCTQSGPIEWWHQVINGKEEPLSATSLAKKLSQQLGVNVNERTVRRWANAGRISRWYPYGPQPAEPPYQFIASEVLDEVARMDRQCPTCGSLWSGRGDVCYRCYSTVNHGQPRYAERPERAAVGVATLVRLPKALAPRLDIERDICGRSDLPIAWCACGNHAS